MARVFTWAGKINGKGHLLAGQSLSNRIGGKIRFHTHTMDSGTNLADISADYSDDGTSTSSKDLTDFEYNDLDNKLHDSQNRLGHISKSGICNLARTYKIQNKKVYLQRQLNRGNCQKRKYHTKGFHRNCKMVRIRTTRPA